MLVEDAGGCGGRGGGSRGRAGYDGRTVRRPAGSAGILRYIRLAVWSARYGGDRAPHTISAMDIDALSLERSLYAAAHHASGLVVGVSAVVSVGGARATRIFGVTFPLALVARDACFSRTFTLASYC